MNLDALANLFSIANGMCTLLSYLPKAINQVKNVKIKNRLEIKVSYEKITYLNEYLDRKKNKEEKKRCSEILKIHNLPKTVGVMCKSENDIYFLPSNTILDKSLNNLTLKSTDEKAALIIGGGFFAFTLDIYESNILHQKMMYGSVVKINGEIYLLRHPLGGYPYYFAKLDLFINGIIAEFNDGFKIGLYY